MTKGLLRDVSSLGLVDNESEKLNPVLGEEARELFTVLGLGPGFVVDNRALVL